MYKLFPFCRHCSRSRHDKSDPNSRLNDINAMAPTYELKIQFRELEEENVRKPFNLLKLFAYKFE